MADYVLDLIRRELGLPSRREWLERPETREPVDLGPDAVVEALHDARAERDAHIAAALGRRDTWPGTSSARWSPATDGSPGRRGRASR
jgi:hypothetical protein